MGEFLNFDRKQPCLAAAIRCVQPFDHGPGDSTSERQQRAGFVSLEDIERAVSAEPRMHSLKREAQDNQNNRDTG